MTKFENRIWYGGDLGGSIVRAALSPVSGLFRVAGAIRGSLYDAGVLRVHAGTIPAVSVGNLTVGGTGKTPVAAWIASELRARGARPAIVLRGYGDDEPLVHGRLSPGIPVIVDPDRVAGIARAAAGGADVAVLDDAFQHRRAARAADIVLVSADQWPGRIRLLPTGPFREPLSAIARATLAIITCKAADAVEVERVHAAITHAAPALPVAVLRLRLGTLHDDAGPPRPLTAIAGKDVLAISAIGDPNAFAEQLAAAGARVRAVTFPDHFRFAREHVEQLVGAMRAGEQPVCTLKDYVKLDALWPRQAPPLWYVSQSPYVESGRDAIEAMLSMVLRARATPT